MKTLLIIASVSLAALAARCADVVIYPQGILTNKLAKNVNCPGDNRWHASYTKSALQGWGWQTNGPGPYTAEVTNRTDVHITYFGYASDTGCGANPTTISKNPPDMKYRWTVWGTNNPPATTNDLPLVIHDFSP